MRTTRSGYVLIMLLVVIAIGMMIYYADLGIFTGPGMHTKHEDPCSQPWARESSIKEPYKKHAAKPAASAPVSSIKITKPLSFVGNVLSSDKQPRGRIVFIIQPDGTCKGSWKCSYSYTHAAYTFDANFAGNTDPTYLASDAAGKLDTSRLNIVGKGNYTQQATNLDTGEITATPGTIYLNGWLSSTTAASGKLSIRTSKTSYADYFWSAAAK